MKFFIVLCLTAAFGFTKGEDTEKINDGASTSRIDEVLTDEEMCKIKSFVDSAVDMVIKEISKDYEDRDKLNMNREVIINRIFLEDLLFSDSMLRLKPVFSNYKRRREYFIVLAFNSVLEKLLEFFPGNFSQCSQDDPNKPPVLPAFLSTNFTKVSDFMITMFLRLGITIEEIDDEWDVLSQMLHSFRNKRSLKREKVCYTVEKFARQRWDELFVYLSTRALVKLYVDNESTIWLCDFIKLFKQYKFKKMHEESCKRKNFGSFLYMKISQLQEWNNCNNFDESMKPPKWCRAWRRIMLGSDIKLSFKNLEEDERPPIFHQDLKTIIDWTYKKINEDNYNYSFFPKPTSKNIKAQNLTCLNIFSLSCSNFCVTRLFKVASARAKRSDDISYEQEYFKDENNYVRCSCPEENEPETESGNWFSDLFGKILGNKCYDGSPQYESVRCEDLRR